MIQSSDLHMTLDIGLADRARWICGWTLGSNCGKCEDRLEGASSLSSWPGGGEIDRDGEEHDKVGLDNSRM